MINKEGDMYKNKGYLGICTNMDGPRVYYVKWNKPDGERQILDEFTYMWDFLKKFNKISKHTIQNKKRLTEIRNKLMASRG